MIVVMEFLNQSCWRLQLKVQRSKCFLSASSHGYLVHIVSSVWSLAPIPPPTLHYVFQYETTMTVKSSVILLCDVAHNFLNQRFQKEPVINHLKFHPLSQHALYFQGWGGHNNALTLKTNQCMGSRLNLRRFINRIFQKCWFKNHQAASRYVFRGRI